MSVALMYQGFAGLAIFSSKKVFLFYFFYFYLRSFISNYSY